MTGELPELLIAGAGAFLAMLLIALAYPRGMGMGDVKLAGRDGAVPGPGGDSRAVRRISHRARWWGLG